MKNNLRLKILLMSLLSVLLLLFIIGPEINGVIIAANNNVDSRESDVVDSEKKTTKTAIDAERSPFNVTIEINEPNVAFQLKYDKYPLSYTYLLINNDTDIRKGPSSKEPVLRTVSKNEKLNYIETIESEEKWYHVIWQEGEQQLFGFVNGDTAAIRVFQFDKMHEAILKAEKSSNEGPLTYINNYHNVKGYAPRYHEGELDKKGNRRSQSAPGYFDISNLSEFDYIGDGTLVRVLSTGPQYTGVSLVKDENVYLVPNKYVADQAPITTINKAIVIDRINQNEAVFEKIGQEWKVISYTLATTGKVGKYHQLTPLGYFYAIEKRERFYYYEDGTARIQGYAPYVIRFAGGAYVHGVPIDYKYDAEGNRIDPGKVEYSRSIGTVPLSHKCVRNYTSHAKFLYDLYAPGEVIVIVIEGD
ncbi:MAG: L,D-transpeptidase family protein [Eubacteriales bacterium]|nr:L,D-transpeptidase family protein [Eubacteriales bacterium]MDD3199975.1 L,D-transpeptidase family protein [Eubacteriales bacterium]MDD4630202.1 L,D-transpeptidase family protein [Eubacteriales bacterium]